MCDEFPDVVDLVTLDFEIQALFWNFHRVQAVYYQLVGNAMSLVIQPGGLSESRREYLYLHRETVCETTVPGCYSPAFVENQ